MIWQVIWNFNFQLAGCDSVCFLALRWQTSFGGRSWWFLCSLTPTWPEKQEYTLTISLPSWEQTWHIPYQTNTLELMIAAKAVIEVDKNTLLRRLRGHGDAVTCASFAEADKSRTLDPQKWEDPLKPLKRKVFLLHLKMVWLFWKMWWYPFWGWQNKRNKLGAELS